MPEDIIITKIDKLVFMSNFVFDHISELKVEKRDGKEIIYFPGIPEITGTGGNRIESTNDLIRNLLKRCEYVTGRKNQKR